MNTIAKFLLVLFTTLLFNSCENNDESKLVPKLNLKIPSSNNISKESRFEEIIVKVYDSKNNWLNESGEIFSGNFDQDGKIEIPNKSLVDEKEYYIDAYTPNRIFSNWGSNIYKATTATDSFQNIFFSSNGSKFLGEWKFSSIINQRSEDLIKTPISLEITKDFKLNLIDEINGQLINVNYEITNIISEQLQLNLIKVDPKPEDYTYITEWFVNYVTETDSMRFPTSNFDFKIGDDYAYTRK